MTKKKQPEHTEGEELTPKVEESQASEVAEVTPEAKAEEYLNDLKRLQADFDNYKKRQSEAEKSLKEYLIQGIVLDLIPVLDNFNAATGHVPEEQKASPWVVGIQYIQKQLFDTLQEHGVKELKPTIGDVFDPKYHEALESQIGEPENTVYKVMQSGYQLGERVVRPAKVAIYSKQEKDEVKQEKGGENS
jgi:molecular chaperone GrpE